MKIYRAINSSRARSVGIVAMSVLMFAVVVSISSSETAAHDAKDPRHMAMTKLGDNMKAIGRGLRAGEITDGMKNGADEISKISGSLLDLFTEPGHRKNSRAKPEIWTDFAGFTKANQLLITGAATLSRTLRENDVEAAKAALKQTGDSCSGCHKAYRLPKK